MSPAITEKQEDGALRPLSAKPVVHYPFWFGGSAASVAAVVTHPLDLGT
jgi:dicarboxylate transporter 10